MQSLPGKILNRVRGDTLKLLSIGAGLLLVWGTVAPIGTLVWWLRLGAEDMGLKPFDLSADSDAVPPPPATRSREIDCYIIYLPGVGDASANELTPGEELFLSRLQERYPTCATVGDVFPYSVVNRDVVGERFIAPFWRAVKQGKGWFKNTQFLIQIRNLWRFALSADDRYGPVYNRGIAAAILYRMDRAYPLSRVSRRPIRLILTGTSGGVQVTLGALPYLRKSLQTEPVVVSLGGAFDGEAGFDDAKHVYHLYGQRDWVDDVPAVVFASRWPWAITSPFNRARQKGRYTAIDSGFHTHDGDEGYFGTARANPQKRYVDLTVEQVERLPIWSEPPLRKR